MQNIKTTKSRHLLKFFIGLIVGYLIGNLVTYKLIERDIQRDKDSSASDRNPPSLSEKQIRENAALQTSN
jgi:uncharacterized protein YneF (UPF0154 family)